MAYDGESFPAGVENLLKLADLLETIHCSVYDQKVFKNDCGTTACAMGWGALSGQLPYEFVSVRDKGLRANFRVKGAVVECDVAASLVFGVGRDDFHRLFGANEQTRKFYNRSLGKLTPKYVASKIREYALEKINA